MPEQEPRMSAGTQVRPGTTPRQALCLNASPKCQQMLSLLALLVQKYKYGHLKFFFFTASMRRVRIGREHTQEHRAAEATGGDRGVCGHIDS